MMEAALRAVTSRVDCGHGHIDVRHVAPFHFDGPACVRCSDAEYADRMQRLEPCVICAALAEPAAPTFDRETLAAAIHSSGIASCRTECPDPPEFRPFRGAGAFSGADYDFAGILIEEYIRLRSSPPESRPSKPVFGEGFPADTGPVPLVSLYELAGIETEPSA